VHQQLYAAPLSLRMQLVLREATPAISCMDNDLSYRPADDNSKCRLSCVVLNELQLTTIGMFLDVAPWRSQSPFCALFLTHSSAVQLGA
jgi:hypothetical protein